ncbi:unnamed protein product [Caenorhabditis nigoni]
MGHAYQWLPTKNNFSSMEFLYDSRSITVKLVSDYVHTNLIYKELWGGTTSVESGRNSLTIENAFQNIFCEDLELIIANQKIPTMSLVLKYNGGYDRTRLYDDVLDFIIPKLFDCLEKSLKSRKELLQVDHVVLEPFRLDQAMSIIHNLDPFKLSGIEIFHFHECWRNNINGISSLIKWNQGSKLELNMSLVNLTHDKLVIIKQDLSFDVPYQQLDSSGFKQFIFTLQNQETDQPKNEVSISSIDPVLSGKVSRNLIIMESVLKNLECCDIQRLRKTSFGIRKCIDLIEPEPHIEKYFIEFASFNQIITSFAQRNGLFKEIKYGQSRDLSEVQCVLCGKTSMEGEDLGRIVLNDFKINLQHQKTCLDEFYVNFSFVLSFCNRSDDNLRPIIYSLTSEFTEKMDHCLKSMPPVRVRNLVIGSVNQEDVFRILSHVHPDFLKVIEIRYPFKVNVEKCLEVDKICQLNQWKSAEELIVNSVTISTGIQEMEITHFASVDILVETIYAEDIVYLKVELLKSSNFKKFKIIFSKSTLDQSVLLSLGEPYRSDGYTRIWYFRFPNSTQYLHIFFHSERSVVFNRVEFENTPFFERIVQNE